MHSSSFQISASLTSHYLNVIWFSFLHPATSTLQILPAVLLELTTVVTEKSFGLSKTKALSHLDAHIRWCGMTIIKHYLTRYRSKESIHLFYAVTLFIISICIQGKIFSTVIFFRLLYHSLCSCCTSAHQQAFRKFKAAKLQNAVAYPITKRPKPELSSPCKIRVCNYGLPTLTSEAFTIPFPFLIKKGRALIMPTWACWKLFLLSGTYLVFPSSRKQVRDFYSQHLVSTSSWHARGQERTCIYTGNNTDCQRKMGVRMSHEPKQ